MTDTQLRESILVADCGSITTRVMLLDVVGGQYRFIAGGQAPSTGEPPWSDVTVGLLHAIAKVEAITDRQIVSEKGRLLIPAREGVSGVDLFVATTSAAPALKTALIGLMDDVSLASARRVALSTYATIVDVIGLADGRTEGRQIQQLVALEPDVFLLTGGTDGGATESITRLAEMVSIVISLLGKELRPPTVVYAGNSELRPVVAKILSGAQLRAAENVRPQVDVEYLDSAQAELSAVFEEHRLFALSGAEELSNLADKALVPTAKAFGWTVQYLGEALGPKSNVIGVDVGSASVTMGAAINGRAQLTVRSDLGIGHHLPQLLEQVSLRQVLRWLPYEMAESDLRDFVANKALFPHTIPMTLDDLHLELALARELIRVMLLAAFPERFSGAGVGTAGVVPPVEMILASGAVLANAPRPGQAALVLLDALQPVGLCSLTLDTQGLAAGLGAIANLQPVAAVQVIESGAFLELGSVVVPVGQANSGDVILHLTMVYDNGSELEVEVEYGSLEVLPLPAGQGAELQLRPLRRFDVGVGPGRSCRRRVHGGAVGLVVDARGRPIRLPADSTERQTRIQQWLWDMGG